MIKRKSRQPQRIKMQMSDTSYSQTTVKPLPLPAFSDGITSLWQSLLDILTVTPQRMPQISVQIDDKTALLGDVQIVLEDARQAHHQLLNLYPELVH